MSHRGGNRWLLRIPLADGSRRVSTVTAVDADDAVRQLDELVSFLSTAGQGAVGGVTVRGFVGIWLDRCDRRASPSRITYRSRAETHILTAPWADDLLVNLTPRTIRRHFRGLPVKTKTASLALSLLRTILADAVEEELLETNPAEGIRLKVEAAPEVRAPLTEDQLEAVLAATEGADRALIAVAAVCGLRSGEAHALPIDCVHLDARPPVIHVRFGGFGGRPTKGRKERWVPVFGPAFDALSSWLAEVPRDRTRNPEGLLFPGRYAGRRRLSHASNWLRVRLRAAGLDLETRFHDLRHTAADGLENGWWGPAMPREHVQAVLGHSSIVQTEAYSSGSSAAMLRSVAAWAPKDQRRISAGVSQRGMAGIPARNERSEQRTPCSAATAVVSQASADPDPSPILQPELVEAAEHVIRGVATRTLTDADVQELVRAVIYELPPAMDLAARILDGYRPVVGLALRLAEFVVEAARARGRAVR